MPSQLNASDTDLLAKVPLLSGLTDDDRERFLAHALVRRYGPKTVLMEKGDSASNLYVILQGRVRIYARGEDDKEVTLNEIDPGQYFGELALIDGRSRSASAMTQADSRLLVISKTAFTQFLAESPEAALRVIHDLAERVRGLTRDVERLALRDVYGRLVDTLNERVQDEDGRLITDPITQKELAQLIGSSREMVSRIFKDLKAGDYISLEGKRVVIQKRLPSHW